MGTKKKLVILYVRVGLTFALHVLFGVLLLVKVSENVSEADKYPWAGVFMPIFCFDILLIVYYFIYLFGYIRKKVYSIPRGNSAFCYPGHNPSVFPVVFYGLALPLKIAAEIVLVLHLHEEVQIPFYAVGFLLSMFFSVLTVGIAVDGLRPTIRCICGD